LGALIKWKNNFKIKICFLKTDVIVFEAKKRSGAEKGILAANLKKKKTFWRI